MACMIPGQHEKDGALWDLMRKRVLGLGALGTSGDPRVEKKRWRFPHSRPGAPVYGSV